jgi:DMSO reductase family type II enzyme heme b subunit
MKDIYPNMNPDAYPMEFPDSGNVKGLTQEKRDVYAHGVAAGNPQAFQKRGVDEIYAEGFGSSAVANKSEATSSAEWSKNQWTVVIVRPLTQPGESALVPGKSSFMAFAVWQGGKGEVGSRKSLTMNWVPIKVQAQ